MHRIRRTTLVALLATFALSGLGAASATAALPEIVTAKYPLNMTGSFSPVYLNFEHIAGAFECRTGGSLSGSFINSKEFSGYMTFKECKSQRYGECSSNEPKFEHQIVFLNLHGTIGYLNKAKKEVGLSLNGPMVKYKGIFGEQIEKPGDFSSHVKCPGLEGTISGHLLGLVTAAVGKTNTFSVKYRPKSGALYQQEFEQFEGAPYYEREEHMSANINKAFERELLSVETLDQITTGSQFELKA